MFARCVVRWLITPSTQGMAFTGSDSVDVVEHEGRAAHGDDRAHPVVGGQRHHMHGLHGLSDNPGAVGDQHHRPGRGGAAWCVYMPR